MKLMESECPLGALSSDISGQQIWIDIKEKIREKRRDWGVGEKQEL